MKTRLCLSASAAAFVIAGGAMADAQLVDSAPAPQQAEEASPESRPDSDDARRGRPAERAEAAFLRLDRNDDDFIDIDDKPRRRPGGRFDRLLDSLLRQFDSDGDERVSRPEFGAPGRAAACELPEDDVLVLTTSANVDFVRTPDACFEELADYPFTPNYVEIDGLRMHYVDEGPDSGPVVLMLHGQPSWSYLYREMIPVLASAGYRVIAPDHIGMGRSDKPIDPTLHQFERHVSWTKQFIGALELADINLFVQDWGSHFGLRVAGDDPSLFDRIILANGDLVIIPEGENAFQYPTFAIDESLAGVDPLEFFRSRSTDREEGFQEWIDYASSHPDLNAGEVVQVGTVFQLSPEEVASYNAPFPSQIYKGAIRAFPAMIANIAEENAPAFAALGKFESPFLSLAGEFDTSQGSVETQEKWINHVPGADGQPHNRYPAGHFIQDDVGLEMAIDVAQFIQSTEPADAPAPGASIFNFRFCELVLLYSDRPFEAWTTIGVNDCPQELWRAIDLDAVADEAGAVGVSANGPRFFVADGSTGESITPTGDDAIIQTFGELEMRLTTTVDNSGNGGQSPNDRFYAPAMVNRTDAWIYAPGRRVHVLEDPLGRKFVMQTYSQSIDPTLSIEDLADLGDRLQLPAGWRFFSFVVEEPLIVSPVDGVGLVVVDDLDNTYLRLVE